MKAECITYESVVRRGPVNAALDHGRKTDTRTSRKHFV